MDGADVGESSEPTPSDTAALAPPATPSGPRRSVKDGVRRFRGWLIGIVVVAIAGTVTGWLQDGFRRVPDVVFGSDSAGPHPGKKVFTAGENPVVVYSGPSDQLDAYQGVTSLVTPSPVFLRCSLRGAPVGEKMNPLWYFAESRSAGSNAKGWVTDHWLNTGTSRSLTPACVGNIADPTVGSGVPNGSAGPFAVIVDEGRAVAVRRAPTPSSASVGTLEWGDIVVLVCSVAGDSVNPAPRALGPAASNAEWDRIAKPIAGWIPDSNVSSNSPGSVAPACPS